MNLLILGHSGHGKNEVADIIKDLYGLPYLSSSEVLCPEVVYPVLKDRYGYKTPAECHADRHNHQQEWYEELEKFNTPDESRLVKLILSRAPVYVGLRSPREYHPSRHLFDRKLWIDRSLHEPPEPSMRIEFDPQDMDLIDNNGSLADLENNIVSVLGSPRPLHSEK